MSIGLFYGSTNGGAKSVATLVANELGAEVFDVKEVKSADEFAKFDTLVLASSTYGLGEMQDDWLNALDLLDDVNFVGKKVALVGVGNQARHGDSFCSSIVDFLPKVKGASLIGSSELDGYKFDYSAAFINGKFIGLCVDFKGDENWEARAKAWCDRLKKEI
ncbi:MAG: flavodoxin [Campylobacteraceae bacterium]|nr:flavodoxin [Campylobacteraceae bacterium]